jgi:heme-degrading monooxygenase HmoA
VVHRGVVPLGKGGPVLDEEIAQAAKATPGYLGEESWENTTTGLLATVYYWESLDALLWMSHPTHVQAKSKQSNWLDGYQVVISQVLRTYGDSKLAGMLPTTSAA